MAARASGPATPPTPPTPATPPTPPTPATPPTPPTYAGFGRQVLAPLLSRPPSAAEDPRAAPTLADADRRLAELWRAWARGGPPPRAVRLVVGEKPGLLIESPARDEVRLAASVPTPQGWRYFSFEAQSGAAPLLEVWGPDGGRVARRLPDGTEPTLAAFCAAIAAQLGEPVRVATPFRFGPVDARVVVAVVVFAAIAALATCR
jgi:hypothetical protein